MLSLTGFGTYFGLILVLRRSKPTIEVPLGTIKSRINRARIQLQAELSDLK